MSRKSSTAEVNVNDKLKELNLDTDDADVSVVGGEAEAEADEEVDEDSDDDEDEQEEEEDGEVEDDVYDPLNIGDRKTGAVPRKAPRSRLRDALFEPSARRRHISPPPAPRALHEMAHPLPPEPEENQVVVIRPDRTRKEKVLPPPNLKKLGALAKKLPGAERIRIRKRMDNGQLGVIGDYSLQDLSGSLDVETFVMRHLKPKFGAGTYKITGIDAAGNELDAGEIPVIDPVQSKDDSALNLIQELLRSNQQQQREFMEAAATNKTNGSSVIEQLEGLHRVHKEMNPPPPPPPNTTGDLAAMMGVLMQTMASQQQQTMQMMASQAQQAREQQAAMTQVLVAAMQPKEDSSMKAILAELVKSRADNSNAALPPPPLPPPSNPFEGMKEMVEIMATVMGGGRKQDDELKELVKSALAQNQQAQMGPRDWISLIAEMKGTIAQPAGNDFRTSMENMSMMLQVANNLRNSTENTASASVWDAIASLFSNRDFAGSIAQTIRSKSENHAAMQRMQTEQKLLKERQGMLSQLRQERVAAGLPPTAAGAPGVPVSNVVPMRPGVPVGVPVVPVVPGVPGVPGAPPDIAAQRAAMMATQQAERAAAAARIASQAEDEAKRAARASGMRLPPMPAQTPEHITQMAAATDAAGRIQAAVTMLIYWAEFEDFKPLVEMLLSMVKAGDRRDAIQLTGQLFDALSGMAMIPPELAAQVTADIDTHFDDIQSNLSDLQLDGDGDEDPFDPALAEDGEGDDDEDDEDDGDDEEGA